MGTIGLIRKFVETIIGSPIVIARERSEWSMGVDEPLPRLTLPFDLWAVDEEDTLYREYISYIYPRATNYSDIVLSLLHEIGHWQTRNEVDWIAYYDEIKGKYGMDYFEVTAERKATEWAIRWLRNAEHRKLAKEFEYELGESR
jgi:hypothetical protein